MCDHDELKRLAEAATLGDWWSDDDVISHQEVSREDERFIYAFTPAVCSALLSEIAALRGDVAALDEMRGTVRVITDRATQAERQRDELRKALEPFAEAAESLDDKTRDHDHIWEQPAAMSIDAGHLRTARALIANQGADQ